MPAPASPAERKPYTGGHGRWDGERHSDQDQQCRMQVGARGAARRGARRVLKNVWQARAGNVSQPRRAGSTICGMDFDDPLHDREVGQRASPTRATRDTTRIDDTRIDAVRPLITPALLMEKLPGSAATLALVERSREQIARVLRGEDHRLVVIVGPCSIHDHAQAIEYAAHL